MGTLPAPLTAVLSLCWAQIRSWPATQKNNNPLLAGHCGPSRRSGLETSQAPVRADWKVAKLVPAKNDLATLFPEVAKEADGWQPSDVAASSNRKFSWRCAKGHTWQATVDNRTRAGSGCPYCSGRRALTGVNDLATLFPELAKEADGWDPSSVKPKAKQKRPWRCKQGHSWEAPVSSRTPPNSTGCPVCSGRKVVAGVNDLATVRPDLAAQANGWDTTKVTAGSKEKKSWNCEKGHIWQATVQSRSSDRSSGCPYCSRNQVAPGETDLATLYPALSKQANGWDPATVSAKSSKKLPWLCPEGHSWVAVVASRTREEGGACPICSGRKVLPGFNDLATNFPEVAKQAEGWDPVTVTAGSKKKALWRCQAGHTWKAAVGDRTRPNGSGCPICSGLKVLAGFNDLATLFPELASQVIKGDPKTVTPKSNKKLLWRCNKGHVWEAAVQNRTPPASTGCPECSENGFKTSLPAWLYLLARPGEQQLGVTNRREGRLREHAPFGWSEVEVMGPFPGDQVLALEKKFKKWLRKEVGLVPGTHENWFTTELEVSSLAELKAKSGVETELL